MPGDNAHSEANGEWLAVSSRPTRRVSNPGFSYRFRDTLRGVSRAGQGVCV
jgi:hypothetical protein